MAMVPHKYLQSLDLTDDSLPGYSSPKVLRPSFLVLPSGSYSQTVRALPCAHLHTKLTLEYSSGDCEVVDQERKEIYPGATTVQLSPCQ